MSIFKIHHITKYEYDRAVKESMNEIKIFPYQCSEQEILQHELQITGHPDIQHYSDYWGNRTGVFNVLQPHKSLVIESKLLIRTTSRPLPIQGFSSGFTELETDRLSSLQMVEMSSTDFIHSQAEVNEIAGKVHQPGRSVAATVEACGEFIFKKFKYIKGITNIETTVDEILEHHAGVCQDFAHLMLQILRTLKIPSRYVSGYICPNKNGMRGEGATHAWVEAWIPDYGWAGIDPTNNVWVMNHHVKLAVGRHFNDCTPVKGTFKGPARQVLSVYVSVGYEDGNTFEEMNNVHLQTQGNNPGEEILDESFAGQQQQ